MDPLASPNLKLGRAYEHYTAFNGKLSAFQEANPYTTYREPDPHSSLQILKLKVVGRPHPDPKWGTIVGDFAGNLRGALDHLVWAMSVTPKEPHKVEFPIQRESCTLDGFKAKHARRIGAIPDEAQNLIEGLQPYKQWGNPTEHALWRIKCLANADKHRTVSIVASGLHFRPGTVLPGPTTFFIPLPVDTQVDPAIPDTSHGPTRPWLQTGSNLKVDATFAIITTEGLMVPVEHLFGLYEFVRDKVFPLFPDRFFPK